MSDETTPPETWTAVGATLVHADRIVGSLSTPELAEWVAEACETLAEMDKAQAEWEASDEAPRCAVVNIGGEEMRVQGGAEMPEPLREAMGDVVSTVRRNMAEAKAAERAEIEQEVRAQCAAELRRDAAGHRQRGLGTSEQTQELMGHYAGVLEIAADRIARGEA